MSSRFRNAFVGVAAAAVAAMALAPAAEAAGRNLANGGFPQPANGTAMLLNLSGGAHFILATSAGLVFYAPTNAAAYAMAPYGIALDGVTILPNPTTTSCSCDPPPVSAPPVAAPPVTAPPPAPVGPISIPPPVIVSLPVGP